MTPVEAGKETRLLTVDDVAQMLACSPRHVAELRNTGRMPAPRKLGRLVRWCPAEISAWLRDGCPAQTAPKRKTRS